ncbi:MAG: VOC family protein [Myxococcales bacterium]|nr:VOC family protein [Myxococcales bacterium]
MKLGFVMVYVDDVPATVDRMTRGLGLECAGQLDDGTYAELVTGETTLAIVKADYGRSFFTDAATRAHFDAPARRFELGFTVVDVVAAYGRAIAAGFEPVGPPEPRGDSDLVAWIRDPQGILIELASS